MTPLFLADPRPMDAAQQSRRRRVVRRLGATSRFTGWSRRRLRKLYEASHHDLVEPGARITTDRLGPAMVLVVVTGRLVGRRQGGAHPVFEPGAVVTPSVLADLSPLSAVSSVEYLLTPARTVDSGR